ncbi:MAG: ATP-binding protein [Pseudomonadota bacterium]
MVLAAVSIGVVAVLWLRLEAEMVDYRQEAIDNIHFNITQIELDLVRFEAEADVVSLQPQAPLTELRKRFDLLYSRFQSVLLGKMFVALGRPEVVSAITVNMEEFLDETTPLIDSSDSELRAALPQMAAQAAELRGKLHVLMIKLVTRYAAMGDERRAAFAALVQRAAWAGAIVIAALAMLSSLVLWLNRQTMRMADQTLRLSSRFAATVRTSLDAIIVSDAKGRVLDYNEAAALTFGYSAQEAIGIDLANCIPPGSRQIYLDVIARLQQDGAAKDTNSGLFQMTARRKGGIEFPIELSIASHQTTDGVIFIAFLRDISDRLQAEMALVQARDAAMAAEKSKTNFMAVMSHEMRTPLNGVMAALEIASGMAVDAKQMRFLDLAQSSARQLLRHANDVLDISKVEAGKMHLTGEDFDLTALAEDLVAGLQQMAAQSGTEVIVSPLGSVPRLVGDYFRISQILQNFLTNALKFTKNGLISIEIEAQPRPDAMLDVEVRVIDTGIGIADKDQDRIFEDFVILDQSLVRTGGGTGLGLAIARRLAHAMGGEVGVESELGEGSCFWLRLPLATADTLEQTAPPKPEPVQKGKTLDILVVEDNATNRIVLEEMLQQMGHCVTMAADGRQGMEVARAHAFDVILMDISMPVMDGLTSTAMIRAQGLSMGSRILAVTAHSMPADLERFKNAGMDGCLTKPISFGNLAAVLRGDGPAVGANVQPAPLVLNPARIDDLREGLGPAGLARMINRFLADFPAFQARLMAACAPDGQANLMAICHEGAGVCAMVGATALQKLYARAEEQCRGDDPTAAADLILSELTPLWTQTEAAILAIDLGAQSAAKVA